MRSDALPGSDKDSWKTHAACRGQDSLFYNEVDETKAMRRSKERHAKQFCSRCPVVNECLGHALLRPERYGVWGGTTEAERHRLADRTRTG